MPQVRITAVGLPKVGSLHLTACPGDFRTAWIGLVHAVANFKQNASLAHDATVFAAEYAATKTGSKKPGDVVAHEIDEVATREDVELVVQKLESVAIKYGVQLSKVEQPQLGQLR